MILFFFLEDNNPKRFPKTQKENRENLFLHFLPNKWLFYQINFYI